ncbi:hypothetical protein ACOBV8_19320 (plasmid) [Pseudoalteromonas espejiana]
MLITSFDEINERIGSLEGKLSKYKSAKRAMLKSLLDSLTRCQIELP